MAEEKLKDDESPVSEAEGSNDPLEGVEGGEQPASTGNKKKKLLIIAGVMLLLLAIPAGLYFSGILHTSEPEATEEGAAPHEEGAAAEMPAGAPPGEMDITSDPVFYTMEEFLVNLNTGGKQVKFLKMQIILELPNQETVAQIELKLPRIRDSFQVYLRELRSEDLQGSGGLYRLREELLLRINKEVYPIKVNNILFKDVLVQ